MGQLDGTGERWKGGIRRGDGAAVRRGDSAAAAGLGSQSLASNEKENVRVVRDNMLPPATMQKQKQTAGAGHKLLA
jgi:hypothetical protein